MRIIEVDSVPKRRGNRHDLQSVIKTFVESDAKFCRIELAPDEYKSWKVCYSCLRIASKRSGHKIKVQCRNEDVYLVKE